MRLLLALIAASLHSKSSAEAGASEGLNISKVRLAFGNDAAHDMLVTWSMASEMHLSSAELLYWQIMTSPSDSKKGLRGHHMAAKSTVEVLEKSDWRYTHMVHLKGLQADAEYGFVIRLGHSQSAEHRFRTQASSQAPAKLLVFADMSNDGSEVTLKALKAEVATKEYAAALHIGDMAYDLYAHHGRRGDIFMDSIESISSKIPYMTAPGNHERRNLFKHYKMRFKMPMAKPEYAWYSWDIGSAHIISLAADVFVMAGTSEQFALSAKEQLLWLVEDLSKANRDRSKRPWIIVLSHRPIYCTNSGRGRDCNVAGSKVRLALERLFLLFGVDLYLCGHMHAYERSWPMMFGNPLWQESNHKKPSEGNEDLGRILFPTPDQIGNKSLLDIFGINSTYHKAAGGDFRGYEESRCEKQPCQDEQLDNLDKDSDNERVGGNDDDDNDGNRVADFKDQESPSDETARHPSALGIPWMEVLRRPPKEHYRNPTATVHITNGLAGVQKQGSYKLDKFNPTQESWSAIRFTDHRLLGYGRLHILNETNILWEQVRAEDGTVLDSLEITQFHHGPFHYVHEAAGAAGRSVPLHASARPIINPYEQNEV